MFFMGDKWIILINERESKRMNRNATSLSMSIAYVIPFTFVGYIKSEDVLKLRRSIERGRMTNLNN